MLFIVLLLGVKVEKDESQVIAGLPGQSPQLSLQEVNVNGDRWNEKKEVKSKDRDMGKTVMYLQAILNNHHL